MREMRVELITEAVAELCASANTCLPEDVASALQHAAECEPWPPARQLLQLLDENQKIASTTAMPICQDTGMAVVFADIGQEVHLSGSLSDAVNEGVRKGYTDAWLRKSIVADPLRRVNTGDNTPAMLHVRLVEGDQVKLTVAPKGFGSENMSRIAMLTPSGGEAAVRNFVLDTVRAAGANPCPPVILGVGIGSDFEGVALLSKRALLVPLSQRNADPYYANLELQLMDEINQLGIGPQGLGGQTSCLGLHILTAPTHIAGLPVAVNVCCHVCRHETVIL